jgi:hydrogenase expression/formation protein HypE
VLELTRAARNFEGLRFMRDPTRGGLSSVAHEIASATGFDLRLREVDIPVRDPVQMICEMLGYDPLYLACEGRVVAIVAPAAAEPLLESWRELDEGRKAAIIGTVDEGAGQVVLETSVLGERLLEELEEDPLPRIC